MTNLPGPWSAAKPTPSKAKVVGESLRAPTPRVKILRDRTHGHRVLVVQGAVFRAGQAVRAFVLQTGRGLHVLVQPVDMHPHGVSKCIPSVLDIAVALPGAVGAEQAEHERVLDVFLRGDAYGAKFGMPHVHRIPVATPGHSPGSRSVHVGSWDYWSHPWKQAAVDAWDDYKETLRSYWS